LNDRFHTLWGSWVIAGPKDRIFFSGDSGYAPHFKDIGEQYGSFDIAFMEAGQYNKLWPDVHMFPDQSYQAGLDVRAKAMMPIHWGAFSLSTHSWKEPAVKLWSKAKNSEITVVIPKIGERVQLSNLPEVSAWWETL
jgi:L-ascorbate metabolism protein UlaG (beta-lactamase superfamily)